MSRNKINKLEEAIAYQEQKLSDLSDVVARQWDEIDVFKKQLARTQDKILELEENIASRDTGNDLSVSEQAARDKPPHY